MTENASEYGKPNLVEWMAGLCGFEALAKRLPGDIYPPYLFVGFFLLFDHGVLQVYIHLNGGTHILLDYPNILAGPVAVFFAVFGIRYMSKNYDDALESVWIQDRVEDTSAFERTITWRVKIAVYALAVVVLYANIIFAVGIGSLIRPGGGGVSLFNWLFVFEFVYLPVIIEFALTYYHIHFLLPKRIKQADIGLFFYDPRNMGGFAGIGQLLKRSYYIYTAGLLLFFTVVYGGVLLSFGGTQAGLFEAVFFSAVWLVGLASIAYSMFTMHQLMSEEKENRIRDLEAELRSLIKNPDNITESSVPDTGDLEEIERRLEQVRSTRVYPATFTMWSQIAISVLLPQVLQLAVQAA